MKWEPQQAEALDRVPIWHREAVKRKAPQIFRLFGYAGTGKTTIAKHFAESIDGDTVYAAYTGKAALMMRKHGCRDASTIHSLIYTVEEKPDGSTKFVLNPDSAAKSAALIVVDECSMVDEQLAQDLMWFKTPILVLGDPAQLPPVKGTGYFTDAKPDVMLTEVRRQALDNPILWMATQVRQQQRIERGAYGASRVIGRGDFDAEGALAADQLIVGRNLTRASYNGRMRQLKGLDNAGPYPVVGDRLVCLRNDRKKSIFNGGVFTVADAEPPGYDDLISMTLRSEDFMRSKPVMVDCRAELFDGRRDEMDWRKLRGTQEFDFGYALTAHKAQGSQWDNIVVFNEAAAFRDEWARWLYTAITRAAETVTLIEMGGS